VFLFFRSLTRLSVKFPFGVVYGSVGGCVMGVFFFISWRAIEKFKEFIQPVRFMVFLLYLAFFMPTLWASEIVWLLNRCNSGWGKYG
jgi:hypothetical protein